MEALDTMLGSAEYKLAVIDKCREKLRSFTALNKNFESRVSRKTLKCLRIIAPIDAEQWESESQGDVGVLRWELMEVYDVVTSTQCSLTFVFNRCDLGTPGST